MHSSTETLDDREDRGEAGHQLTTPGSGPGYRGRAGTGRTRAGTSGSRPGHPGAVLGNDPVPTGGGGTGSWACRARPQPALGVASKVISDWYVRSKREVGPRR